MNDDLDDRLAAVEDAVDDTPDRFDSVIVFTDGDGYVTPDGDPVPTTDDGGPVAPARGGPVVVLPEEYDQFHDPDMIPPDAE